MHPLTKRHSRERGAMIVQMAVASIAFLALAALAVDWGIKLIARTEAQRSADAGALAGAVSLAFDGAADPAETAKESARAYALVNNVFGEPPDVDLAKNDVKLITCPPPNGGAGTTCVQVDVYRNQLRKNPLPTFFSRLVGVTDQGVQATATAKVLSADTTDCLRPWAVIDRWDEFDGTEPDDPDLDFCTGGTCGAPSTFDMWADGKGPGKIPQENDRYVPPAADGSSPGTGYRVPEDVGKRFALKVGANETMTSGWGLALDLPRADTQSGGGGEGAYGPNIIDCNRVPVRIADPAVACPVDSKVLTGYADKVLWAGRGCLLVQPGNMSGGTGSPTNKNVEELILRDANAQWGGLTPEGAPIINDSCCSTSPRIVPVAIVDVNKFFEQDPSGGGGVVRIVNMFGFFIEGMGDFNKTTGAITLNKNGDAVIGRLMKFSGSGSGKVKLNEAASWSKIIVLVR
jgi:Flp pilus assembly protein TadG